ncbi:hypothetical protein VNI00_008353 [Paramarasmius palmivorus]|uniref:RNA-dependent RNA polymerase n=1 Tax=Paramarasmius palmivorus TaxID=297713 RepID=A0AAW0CXA6_9AGAR
MSQGTVYFSDSDDFFANLGEHIWNPQLSGENGVEANIISTPSVGNPPQVGLANPSLNQSEESHKAELVQQFSPFRQQITSPGDTLRFHQVFTFNGQSIASGSEKEFEVARLCSNEGVMEIAEDSSARTDTTVNRDPTRPKTGFQNRNSSRKRPPTKRSRSPLSIYPSKVARTQTQDLPTHPRAREIISNPHTDAEIRSSVRPHAEPPNLTNRMDKAKDVPCGLFEDIFHNVCLETHIIAHDAKFQTLLDDPENPIHWGTAFILTQGCQSGQWTWDTVVEKSDRLRGPDADRMHLVPYIMRDCEPPKGLDNSIGAELDRERKALLENCQRGLGLMGGWEGIDNWYGGKVQLTASLVADESDKGKEKQFRIRLDGVTMTKSTRVTRELGSIRLIQIHVGYVKSSDAESVASFLSQKFVLHGRVFVPLPPNKGTVYAVEINEDYDRRPVKELGDHLRRSFGEILQWQNPIDLEFNQRQPVAKFLSRFALGFSTSVPALEFNPENVYWIDDLVTEDCPPGKPPAEKTLTDGCSLINRAAMCQIAQNLGYSGIPAALQGRFLGAKGVWMLHPDNDDIQPKIWIRPSQKKIDYDLNKLHRAHCILDLLCVAQPAKPLNLSVQLVVNLWSNGVSSQVLKDLMQSGLEDIIKPLTDWNRDIYKHGALWDAVARTAHVVSSRLSLLGGNKSRALGLAGQEFDDDYWLEHETSGDTPVALGSTISDQSRDPNSGQPVATAEAVIEMLESGWHPSDEAYLASKIKKIASKALQEVVKKCHIPLPEGSAFSKLLVIADPLGILGPEEVYFRSSQGFVNPETGTPYSVLIGKLLIGRYPLRLPSDIQMVTAVDKPELAMWQDVLIVPIKPRMDNHKGLMSFMSFLGGGDIDGDTVFVLMLKKVIETFRPKSLTKPPEDIEVQNFEEEVQRVSDLVKHLREVDVVQAQRAFQFASLSSFPDGKFVRYSLFHDSSVKSKGLADPDSVRLGYMYGSLLVLEYAPGHSHHDFRFNILLDGMKTGYKLKDDVFKKDMMAHSVNEVKPKKNFITTRLVQFGKGLIDKHLKEYDQLAYHVIQQGSTKRDTDVLEILRRVESLAVKEDSGRPGTAKYCDEELRLIKQYVDDKVYPLYRGICASLNKTVVPAHDHSREKSKGRSREQEGGRWREVASAFATKVPGVRWLDHCQDRVKASYAYQKNPNFGFLVAHRTLNQIKKEARPEVAETINNMKSMGHGVRKLF